LRSCAGRSAAFARSHLGEEIFHFESQVRDGVIDRFGGVAHDFRGGVERIAVALSLTVESSFSVVGLNDAMAGSIFARRSSWSRIAARSCSARHCSVTSSCVETQPPPGNGSFLASTMRPSLAFT
jgi:hypothetical protein